MKNIGIYLLFAISAIAACTNEKSNEKQANTYESSQIDQTPLHTAILDSKKVCMVNNAYMGKPQIPVTHDGKTYFGCCEMCVEKIKNDRSVRFAIDPVTGKEVDKAQALIILKPGADGEVLYFESEASYKQFKNI